MILDVHVHTSMVIGDKGCYETQEAKLIDCLNRAGIEKANVVPMLTGRNGMCSFASESNVEFMADFLVPLLKKYPEKFYGMLFLNPYLSMGFLTDTIKNIFWKAL